MSKRLLCLIVLLLLLLPATALNEGGFVMAGFDGSDSQHDWSSNAFFTRMEERTGLAFTFQQYNKLTEWQTAKDRMFSQGTLPDVLFKAALTTEELIRYTEDGQLIDLKPLLPENAPHLWALLQENPDWLKAITLPSGKIGALPSIQPVPAQDVLWINKQWLDKLGLALPADMDSLEKALAAFRDGDPNGNGKQDEIPLGFLGPWELKLFSHAYGVTANDYNIYLDEDGTVRFWPAEDGFLDMAARLRDMYREGLLDPDGFQTVDLLRRSTDEKADVRYGAFFAPTPVSLLSYDQAQSYVALDPLVYQGERVYRDLIGPVIRGTFAITSACADPAAMLRWVDILYTEEGAVEAMLGKEGEAWLNNDEGWWQWKGGAENVTSAMLSQLSVYDTGNMPWLFPQAFYERYEEEGVRRITQELNRFATYVKRPFPVYTLTLEEDAVLLPLQNALGRYVDESLAKFITGDREINQQTAADFRAELESLGMKQMTDFWQAVAERLAQEP